MPKNTDIGDHILLGGNTLTAKSVGDGRQTLVTSEDESTLDAFHRVRVGLPYTLADIILQYDLQPTFYDPIVATGGTVTHLPLEAAARLRTSTTINSSAIFQTRRYYRYQAGKAGEITLTAVIGAGVAGVRKRWGFFDDDNGLFFEQIGTEFAVVTRSNTSGVAVDDRVVSTAFNGDPVDGSGHTGFTLDLSKGNIFSISFQWLGVGVVTFSVIDTDGNATVLHQFKNPGVNETVYMRTASLPVRWDIFNVTAQTAVTDMKAICTSVVSNGGETPAVQEFTVGSDLVTTTSAAEVELITYRLALLWKGVTNRSIVLPREFHFEYRGSDVNFRVVYHRGTVAGGSFVAVSPGSCVEYNIGSVAVPGALAEVIYSRNFLGDTNPSKPSGENISSGIRDRAMSLSADGFTTDYITIYASRIGAVDIEAAGNMTWGESR